MSVEERLEIGDECPQCSTRIGVLNTFLQGSTRVRYIGCSACGWRPADNKRTVPVSHAPAQRPRMKRIDVRRGRRL